MTVMFVEHDMDVVYDISDWVVVMAEGRIIAEGRRRPDRHQPQVIDAYLGAHHDAVRSPRRAPGRGRGAGRGRAEAAIGEPEAERGGRTPEPTRAGRSSSRPLPRPA